MSSETSINEKDQGLQPWMFFVLAGLLCATVATFMARGQSISAIVLVTLTAPPVEGKYGQPSPMSTCIDDVTCSIEDPRGAC